jgi:hypothetical protein
MKLLLALLSISVMIGLAVPARGDPDSDDGAFLASLQKAGITYQNAGQAIAAGKAVCGLIDEGESGLEVVEDLKTNNPAFTMDGAAKFAAISAHAYCPQQLTPSAT